MGRVIVWGGSWHAKLGVGGQWDPCCCQHGSCARPCPERCWEYMSLGHTMFLPLVIAVAAWSLEKKMEGDQRHHLPVLWDFWDGFLEGVGGGGGGQNGV